MENVCVSAVGWESPATVAPATTCVCLRMDLSAVDVASVCVESANALFQEHRENVASDALPVEISAVYTGKTVTLTFIMNMQCL